MSSYRDDLDAARHRIATLEAERDERDARIRARDARVAELEAELERLRSAAGPANATGRDTARYNRLFMIVGAVLAVMLVAIVGAVVLVRAPPTIAQMPVAPPPVELPPEPPATGGDRSVAENRADTLATSVEAEANRLKPKVIACQRKELEKRPEAKGFLTVTFDVETTGKVSNVTFGKSDVRSEAFDACVKPLIEGLKLSPTPTRTKAQMSFSLLFVPPEIEF